MRRYKLTGLKVLFSSIFLFGVSLGHFNIIEAFNEKWLGGIGFSQPEIDYLTESV